MDHVRHSWGLRWGKLVTHMSKMDQNSNSSPVDRRWITFVNHRCARQRFFRSRLLQACSLRRTRCPLVLIVYVPASKRLRPSASLADAQASDRANNSTRFFGTSCIDDIVLAFCYKLLHICTCIESSGYPSNAPIETQQTITKSRALGKHM